MEEYSYSFANKIGEQVRESYLDPYSAYKLREQEGELCLVLKDQVVKILPTKLIAAKWGVACARRVLNVFENYYPDDKRPRRALEAADRWIKLVETGSEENVRIALEKHIAFLAHDAREAGRMAGHKTEETLFIAFSADSASYAAEICAEWDTVNAAAMAASFNTSTPSETANAANLACAAADSAAFTTKTIPEREKLIAWQSRTLQRIIFNPYFELSKINYHGNYHNLGLDKPFPFRDLGPQIMGY
jgi:hypothetical protein